MYPRRGCAAPGRRRLLVCLVATLVGGLFPPAFALTLDDLDPARQWRLGGLSFSGHTRLAKAELRAALTTEARPWYTPWRAHPLFDPVAFGLDLKRLTRLYRSHGYYHATLHYELTRQEKRLWDRGAGGLLRLRIRIDEGEPIRVGRVDIQLNRQPPQPDQHAPPSDTRLPDLPVKQGDIFTEDSYRAAAAQLKTFFLDRGYGWTEVRRAAELLLDQRTAHLRYRIRPGPPTVFGQTHIEGLEHIAPQLLRRDFTYLPGQRFSVQPLNATRQNLLDLGLFDSVQIAPTQSNGRPRVVPLRVRVKEGPPRDFKLGLGYGTEDEFRGHIAWQHRNWLGGGLRLAVLLKFSSITRSLGVQLVQPHFLTKRALLVLDLSQGQEDEETFLLNYTRFRPRLEHRFSSNLSGAVGYRLEFARLNNISPSTIRALGGIEREGLLSGPVLELAWDTTTDRLDPKRGSVMSLNFAQTSSPDYHFYTLTTEAKTYYALGWQTVVASRLKVGLAAAFGPVTNLPLSERLYAGGEKSVRGYGRRRLGPLSRSDDPLGGLSLIEGSVELRRPVWKALSGAVFVDFGQLEARAYDIPIDALRFAAGFGLGYATRFGPIQLHVGFPFDPPSDDDRWQLHFSVGQFF